MEVESLRYEDTDQIIDVLFETFYDYPAMKYILGEKDDYNQRLLKLISFFTKARFLKNEPVLGITNVEGKLVAVALITLPGNISTPIELRKNYIKLWEELGQEAQVRYTAYEMSTLNLFPNEPHHHLNMIGVLKAYQGKGLGCQLMNEIESLASRHPDSIGLTLNTEKKSNVDFYKHIGYKLLGKEEIDNSIISWGFIKSLISWIYLVINEVAII